MAVRFPRAWAVQVGDLDVSALDIEFSAMRSIRREPNEAEVKIYNLSPDSHKRLADQDSPTLILRAGYVSDGDPPPTIFVGDVRELYREPSGVDVVTRITARDGGRAFRQSRISKSYGEGTSVLRVLKDAVEAMGVGRGNLEEFQRFVELSGGATSFPDGFVATGPAHRVLNSILRGAGLRWSVQNNAIQIMRRRRALQSQIVRLTSDSGLVGTPTVDDKGVVTATALLQPGIDPGRLVRVDSREIQGDYEIRRVEYSGATAGGDWYAKLELKAQ